MAGHPGTTVATLKAAALRQLARREHSRAELQRKLVQHAQRQALRQARLQAERPLQQQDATGCAPPDAAGTVDARSGSAPGPGVGAAHTPPPVGTLPAQDLGAQIDAVLDSLQGHGLLSDERVAQQWLASRAPRHGERRLRQDLKAKGLAPELVAQTLAQARDSEEPRALALWQRRFGQPAASAADHARQVRFLAGRGFGMDTIHRVLRQVRAGAACAPDGEDGSTLAVLRGRSHARAGLTPCADIDGDIDSDLHGDIPSGAEFETDGR